MTNVANIWPAGAEVGVYPRVFDHRPGPGKPPLKSVTVGPTGEVSVGGIPGAPYWLAGFDPNGEWRALGYTMPGSAAAARPDQWSAEV